MLVSNDAVLVATSIVLAVSTIVSLSIQLERQYKAAGELNASKWFLVASAFFALVMTSLVCAAAAKGLGAQISAQEFASRVSMQKLILAAFPPYFLCNMLVKHAWLTFYYGLARSRAQRYFIHFMQFVAASFGISSVLVILLQCIPLNLVWKQGLDPGEESSGQCINLIAFFYANSIIMIVNDLVLYLMPMWLLRNVDMLRGHRMSIYALFAVGGLVVIASVMRFVAVYDIATSDNISSNYALIWIWAAVENHVGICAACAGAIKQKSVAAYESVRRSYCEYKSKNSAQQSSDSVTRTQSTEDRTLYEQASSIGESPSLMVDNLIDKKDAAGVHMQQLFVSKDVGKETT